MTEIEVRFAAAYESSVPPMFKIKMREEGRHVNAYLDFSRPDKPDADPIWLASIHMTLIDDEESYTAWYTNLLKLMEGDMKRRGLMDKIPGGIAWVKTPATENERSGQA